MKAIVRKAGVWFATCVLAVALGAPASAHLAYNVVVDDDGNVYFLDIFKNSLMKVEPGGRIFELVDLRGIAPEERLHALAIDSEGNLYVGGYYQAKIWKVSTAGEVSLFHPRPESRLQVGDVLHLGFDASGSLYVVEHHYWPEPGAQRFRVLKSGPGNEVSELVVLEEGRPGFVDLHDGSLLVAANGRVLLSASNRVFTVTPDGGLRVLAGHEEGGFRDGRGSEARFNGPYGMTMDAGGDVVVAELSGRLRRIAADGTVTTIAGSSGPGYADGSLDEARFTQPFAVTRGPRGRLYVVEYSDEGDRQEYRVRVIDGNRVTTLARIPSKAVFRK
jgi:sugar lactone lactonase YvrE